MAEFFRLRPAGPEDEPFIVDSWCMSYKSQAVARDMGPRYLVDYKWFVRALLKKVRVTVACDVEDPGVILGWCASSPGVVHYVFVKHDFRRLGIAKNLLAPWLGKPTIYAAKTHHEIHVPESWSYSWLANVKALLGAGEK